MLIENYTNTVVRFYKGNEKAEIQAEVEEMIYAMLEEKYGVKEEYADEEIKVVLKELGEPNILAIKYSKLPKQLVSEKNMPAFYYSLFIALVIVFCVNIFGTVISMAVDYQNALSLFFSGIWHTILSLCACIGIVTIVFMTFDYNHKEINVCKDYDPVAINKEKAVKGNKKIKDKYSLGEEITNIVTTIVFVILVQFAGKILIDGYQLFAVEFLNKIYFLIIISAILSIVKSLFLIIVSRKKTIIKEVIRFIFSIVSIIIWIFILINGQIISSTILEYFASTNLDFNQFYQTSWINTVNSIVIAISILSMIGVTIEFFHGLYIVIFKINRNEKIEIIQ